MAQRHISFLARHYAHWPGKWDWAKWNCPKHMHSTLLEGESYSVVYTQGVCTLATFLQTMLIETLVQAIKSGVSHCIIILS